MIYLDSAIIDEATLISTWGWVAGITTNPTLLAKSKLSPQETLKKLAQISPGEVYYQLMASDRQGMLTEARTAYDLIGEKTVIKVPAIAVGFEVAAQLTPDIPCTLTAVYSATQATVAQDCGAKSVAIYVNRATRFLGDGLGLVREIAAVLQGSSTEILAASLKTPQEAVSALQAGAHHLTLPITILQAMTTHPLSQETAMEFEQRGVGIKY